MEVEVTLDFEGNHVNFVHEDATYETLEEAIFAWTEGEHGCDCMRSQVLQQAGVLRWILPCKRGRKQAIKLVEIKPFVVH